MGFIKQLLKDDALFHAFVVLLVGTAAFGLGRASVATDEEAAAGSSNVSVAGASETLVEVEKKPMPEAGEGAPGSYVGSVNSDKYHLPWCSGAQRINEENKVWFESKAEAEAAGYTPAGNCKGI